MKVIKIENKTNTVVSIASKDMSYKVSEEGHALEMKEELSEMRDLLI